VVCGEVFVASIMGFLLLSGSPNLIKKTSFCRFLFFSMSVYFEYKLAHIFAVYVYNIIYLMILIKHFSFSSNCDFY
jgi:hypothetical protein